MKNFFLKNGLIYIILIFVTIGVINILANPQADVEQLSYNNFLLKLSKHELDDLVVRPEPGGTYYIEGRVLVGKHKKFVTEAPAGVGSTVLQDIKNAQVNVSFQKAKGDSIWITLITSVVPFAIILLLFFFL